MWKVLGEPLQTADASNTRVHQKFTPSLNMFLSGARVCVILYNDPAFTAMTLKLYSNNAGSPGALIATSTNTQAKAVVITLDHGVKEIYFDFNEIPLMAGETYHMVIGVSGYTGNDSTHIAWKKSYPDPVYQTNVDLSFEGSLVSPFDLTILGKTQ